MRALAVVIGLLIVAAAAWLLWPRIGPSKAAAVSPAPPGSGADNIGARPGRVTEAPHPGSPLRAPMTAEEQVRQDLSDRRVPFFRFLRQNYSDVIEHFSVLDTPETLDLVVSREDDPTLKLVIQNAIEPNAKEYGFRRVRFYVRNTHTSVEPFTLVAESTDDGSGHWNTFRK